MTLMQILGGVALVVFGVRFLRKGLDRLFGQKLIRWLQRMTHHRGSAFAAGVVIGTCAPSSTALSLVAVHLMNAGSMSAERMLSVLLGSGVGLTVMVQMLALHIESSAVWFLFFGVLCFQFLRQEMIRGIGQCLIAFGLIFLAMQMIGGAAQSMAGDRTALTLLQMGEEHPGAVLTFVTLLTVLLQSSTAAIGLGISLAHGGLLTMNAMIPWILGANLGVALTLLLAGYRSLESRRLAMAHLLVKGTGVVLVFTCVTPVTAWVELLPFSTGRKVADFHTVFNLLLGLVALPWVPLLSRVARNLMAEPDASLCSLRAAEPEAFLNEEALETPSLALAHAAREALRMADESQRMFIGYWKAQQEHNAALARKIQAHDDIVDRLYHSLKSYLSRISHENLSNQLWRWQLTLLAFIDELEAASDIIDRHLCGEVIKQVQEGIRFTDDEIAVLKEVYERVLRRLNLARSLLTVADSSMARAFLEDKERLSEFCRRAQTAHYTRLQHGDKAVLSSSSAFLEIMGGFRRINSHLGTLGYAFDADECDRQGTPLASPLESPREGASGLPPPPEFGERRRLQRQASPIQ